MTSQTLSCACIQTLLEEVLVPALGHKNWRVKEEGMQCLTQVLAKYGGQGLALSKFVGTVCRLLEDPNPQVGGHQCIRQVDGDMVRLELLPYICTYVHTVHTYIRMYSMYCMYICMYVCMYIVCNTIRASISLPCDLISGVNSYSKANALPVRKVCHDCVVSCVM